MVYTLTGGNSFALKAFLADLKKEFTAQHGESGVEEYQGEQLNSENLASALGGVSLFASHRFVIIRRLSEAKDVVDQFIQQLGQISEEVTVVLVEPTLDKRTSLYKTLKKDTDFNEFTEVGEKELLTWIQATATSEGGLVDGRTAQVLYEYCGNDQQRLLNEIKKLVAYDPKVTNETVALLVEKNPHDTIFELLELAMSSNAKQALATLSSLEKAHEDPFQIASMLIWQAHIMAVVQSAKTKSDGEIAKDHKINPYVVSKTKRLVQPISKQQLTQIISSVAELDITLKTNAHDPWRALEATILAL